jgi:hypothetical protein
MTKLHNLKIDALTSEDITIIISKYESIVRKNTDENWDAMAAVANDRDGDVVFEVWETAEDLGFTELTDADRDALCDAGDRLKERLGLEVDARQAN